MRHFRRHAYTFAQRRVGVNRLANVHCVGTHFDGQCHFTNQDACIGADDAATQVLAVAVR